MAVLWNAAFEATPDGGDAGSTIDDKIQEFKIMARKCFAVVITDTSDVAPGDGMDEDNLQMKDNCVTSGALNMGQGLVDNSDAVDVDGIVEQGSGAAELKVKVIEIGDWNMDSTTAVNVAHGLTWTKIRLVAALIRNDDDTMRYPLPYITSTPNIYGTITGQIDSNGNIQLARVAGGLFDDTAFDATSYNRGWITIWYEA